MREDQDLETSLLDEEWLGRDMNFEAATWAGVADLMASLESSFRSVDGTDHEGRAIVDPLPTSAVTAAKSGGFASMRFEGGPAPIRNLQVYIAQNEDASPFVELTFWRDEIEPTESLRGDFIAWADSMRRLLRAQLYYVRYESVSWRFGDTGPGSGVFLVSGQEADHA